jgi:hypothetical protein
MFTTIAFLLYQLASFSILFVQEAKASDFEDLGTLLLAGGLMAIGVGVTVCILRLKVHNNEGQGTKFISIRPPDEENR